MSESVVLESLCELIVDCEHKTAPRAAPGEGFAFSIGTPNISGGRLLLDSAKEVSGATFLRWTTRASPREGDLILAREAPVGEVGRVAANQRVCLGQRTVLIRPNVALVNPRFLHYLLLSPGPQELMRHKSGGSTVAHLNVREIRLLKVPRPPNRILQDAVASLLGAVDDKIAVNERLAKIALELAGEHFSYAQSSSPGWRGICLSEAASWYSGGTPSTTEPSYWGGDIPWISASSIKSPWIWDSTRKLTRLGSQSGTRLAPPGAILFVVRGMSLKSEFRIGIAQREVAFGQDCKALIAAQEIDSNVLFHALRSRENEILGLVDEAGHGTGRLATERLARLVLHLPDGGERERIGRLLSSLNCLAARRQHENLSLTKLRDALLPKLISGELRIKDAERQVEDVV